MDEFKIPSYILAEDFCLMYDSQLLGVRLQKIGLYVYLKNQGLPQHPMVKTLPSNAGGAGLMPGQGAGWRRQWQPTPVLLPGKSHGRRSLVGCSPWGREESDTTEQLHFHFSLSFTGEGNGNPLQCSCLENPRDGGARWAAVYGVAQGRTQLT